MRPEHVPLDAYRLLGQLRINKEVPIKPGTPDDAAAMGFLLSRGLAEKTADGTKLTITEEGRAVGRLMKKAP